MRPSVLILAALAGCAGAESLETFALPAGTTLPPIVAASELALGARLGEPGQVAFVAISEMEPGRFVAYGLAADGRVHFRVAASADELETLEGRFTGEGLPHRVLTLCMPGPQADVAGPQPCPPGPRGMGTIAHQ
jgi:hypothetical protein